MLRRRTKGEVLYVTISQIITDSYVICFNHMVSLMGCALTGTARSLLKPARIIFIATALNVFADGPEYKKSNSKDSMDERNTRNDH